MYGLASLAQKYLLPHLQPPTRTSFEQTSSSLSEQFDAAQSLLEEIKLQTKELQDDVEGERLRVGEVVQEVRGMVEKVGEGEERWREEMREMRQEVEELKGLVPTVSIEASLTIQHGQGSRLTFLDLFFLTSAPVRVYS